jgi:hypothetical protein
MKMNMGDLDKVIRLSLSLVIFGLAFADMLIGGLEIVLLVLAGILILTSLFGFCPLYLPFKINTCKKQIENAAKSDPQ